MSKPARSSPNSKKPKASLPGSVGEALDEVDFQPIGRRILAGQKNVPKSPLNSADWVGPAINFFASTLPRDTAGRWEHQNIAAYEVGCEALKALGEAVAFTGGAQAAVEPKLPAILPRWDDIATAVVWLSSQCRLLRYRRLSGAKAGQRPTRLPRPNIRAAHGCPPVYLAAMAFPAFQSLGLILDCRWTAAAEGILWRDSPVEAGMDFIEGRRFIEARDIALATVPDDIATQIREIATRPEDQVVELLDFFERYSGKRASRDDALGFLRERSCVALDELFAKRWRLNDGWLSVEESKRAMLLQLDPLAITMRGEFSARYLPEFPFLHRLNVNAE